MTHLAWFPARSLVTPLLGLTAVAACGPSKSENLHPVTIRARDYAFEAPDTLPAGLTAIRLINDGPSTHHVPFVRLPDTLAPAAALAALPPQEPLPVDLVPVGGPEGADDPRREITAVLRLRPGHYLLLCRFAAEGGRLHHQLGMVKPLTVIGPPEPRGPELLPARDTVTLRDFTFEGPDSIPAGPQTFFVRNRGPHEHHLAIARLLPGKTLADALLEFSTSGAPSATEVLGGVAGIAVGEANLLPIALEPGAYVLICLVPDPATGREHVALGRIRSLTVF